MLYGTGLIDHNASGNQVQEESTWIDYLVMSNPHGVMEVLSRNGYHGYLAPQNEEELLDVTYDYVTRHKDTAVVDLLKSHPLYDAMAEVSKEEKKISLNFLNADGTESSVITSIKSINYKKLIETMLILIGAFYIADKLWGFLNKG